MKYDFIVPYGDEIDELEYGVRDNVKAEPCSVCGDKTPWTSSPSGARVCSEECMKVVVERLRKALMAE